MARLAHGAGGSSYRARQGKIRERLMDTGWIVAGLLAFVIIAMIAWYVVAMFRFTFRG